MKTKVTLILIAAILIAIIYFLIQGNNKLSKENNRLEDNQETLMQGAFIFQTQDSLNAIEIERLLLDRKELNKHYSQLIEDARKAGVKDGRIQAISQFGTSTTTQIVTLVKDSVIYLDTLKCFNFKDEWLKLQGCIKKDSISINYTQEDSLIQIVSRVPKKWWFFRWGTKAIKQTIISKNPRTKLKYLEYIEVK